MKTILAKTLLISKRKIGMWHSRAYEVRQLMPVIKEFAENYKSSFINKQELFGLINNKEFCEEVNFKLWWQFSVLVWENFTLKEWRRNG